VSGKIKSVLVGYNGHSLPIVEKLETIYEQFVDRKCASFGSVDKPLDLGKFVLAG
jgi:hypothetical protein